MLYAWRQNRRRRTHSIERNHDTAGGLALCCAVVGLPNRGYGAESVSPFFDQSYLAISNPTQVAAAPNFAAQQIS